MSNWLVPLLLLRAAHSNPPVSRPRSAYRNLSDVIGPAGCDGDHATRDDREFACTLQCQVHEAVLERVFEPWWDHTFSQAAILDFCNMMRHRIGLHLGAIVRGRVFHKCCGSDCESGFVPLAGGRVKDSIAFLFIVAELAEVTQLPNMYFTFHTGDQPFTEKVYFSAIPHLHFVSCDAYWTLPIPNPYHLRDHLGDRLGDTVEVPNHVPWDQKRNKVFWRGALSAPDVYLSKDPTSISRIRLMRIAAAYPELFDVAITKVDAEFKNMMSALELKRLLETLPMVPPVKNVEEMPKYKYLLNVAAVLSSWRLSELLATKSVLLLQEDATRELIFEWLTPWEHYVPVNAGLSDLVEKVQWLEEHPAEAESIAARSYSFFTRRVRRADTYCYLWQLFRTLGDVSTATAVESQVVKSQGWHEVPATLAAASKHEPLRGMVRRWESEL